MSGYSDRSGCWICDRLVGFDFDLDSLSLTEQEVMEQLGLLDRGPRTRAARAGADPEVRTAGGPPACHAASLAELSAR
jgi:hypothetical protein